MIILCYVETTKKLSSYFQSERTDAFLYNVCELCFDHSQGGEVRRMESCC